MKKFLSMVMAAAMVVSLVPATAFAAGDIKATAKVIDAANFPVDGMTGTQIGGANGKNPELQLTMTTADYTQ